MSNIKVNGEIFRKHIKAASTVALKSGVTPMQYSVLIRANGNYVEICANSLSEAVQFCIETEDKASGTFAVAIDNADIKSLLNIKGSTITVAHEENSSLVTFTDGKKKMTIHCIDSAVDKTVAFSEYVYPFNADNTDKYMEIFRVDSNELLTAIKKATIFTAKDDKRPILCGYHFNRNGKLETVDGYRLFRKTWKTLEKVRDAEYDFVAGSFLENIKNIFSDKENVRLSCVQTDRWIIFQYEGNEYRSINTYYAVRTIDGEYHNCDASMPKSYNEQVHIDAGELAEICKEYKGYISAKDKRFMVLGAVNGKLYAGITTNRISVAQSLEKCGKIDPASKIFAGYNAEYLMDGLSIFNKAEITMRYIDEIHPMLLTDGEYDVLILPCRIIDYDWRESEEEKNRKLSEKYDAFVKTCA